ncbi:MAG: hypothetical protein IKA93_03245 [Elusimicrobiaceae bacterium]|nr:hypothetical protein [Elusimicrobiaceae bacterium]
MSVLNTFSLVFETDGEETTLKSISKIDEAGKKLNKTNKQTADTMDKNAKGAKTAIQQFQALKTAAAGVIAPLLSLGVVLNRTLDFAAKGEQLLFMANAANMAANEFQKLAIANTRFGGSKEGAAGTMAGLASQIQALKFGESAPLQDAAVKYGLSLMGTNGSLAEGSELLRNIARTMEQLDTGAQLDLGRRIGLDEATIRILQRGVAAFDEELAEAEKRKIFTDEDLKRAQEFEMAVRDLKLSLQGVWAEIARWILPALKSFTNGIDSAFSYMREHADAVKATLVIISAIMAGIAVASLAAFAPWLGTAAVIAAISAAVVLLYEDFKTFSKGGESALEPLWKSLGEFKNLWKDMPPLIKDAVKALADLNIPLKIMVWQLKTAAFFLKIIKKVMEGLGSFGGFLTGKLLHLNSVGHQMKVANDAIEAYENNPLKGIMPNLLPNIWNRNDNRTNNSFVLTVNGSQTPAKDGMALLDHARGTDFANLETGQES